MAAVDATTTTKMEMTANQDIKPLLPLSSFLFPALPLAGHTAPADAVADDFADATPPPSYSLELAAAAAAAAAALATSSLCMSTNSGNNSANILFSTL